MVDFRITSGRLFQVDVYMYILWIDILGLFDLIGIVVGVLHYNDVNIRK